MVRRFPTTRHLCSWAGLIPRHIESDTTVIRGRITRMGLALVRWGPPRGRGPADDAISPAYRRIAERRGRKIARVAAARKLVTSCTTACVMAASAASRRRGEGPAQPRRELDARRDPHHGGLVAT
ncbi:MAG: transposase [Actinobacteria bacterium]|nr:transposase [Actinomycetota bacterium]